MKTQFIKERLRELGKDTDWLAEQCMISPVTMKDNCHNGRRPSRPVLKLMAQALKCSVSDIVHEDEIKSAKAG